MTSDDTGILPWITLSVMVLLPIISCSDHVTSYLCTIRAICYYIYCNIWQKPCSDKSKTDFLGGLCGGKMSFSRRKHDQVRQIWYHSEALGQDMKAKSKRIEINIIFQCKFVFYIDYVLENGLSVY